MEGDSKNTSKPGQGIEKCKAECDDREGCTSFEYNHTGEEEYECKTYTNGDADVVSTQAQGYHWTSCISHIQGIIFFQYMLIVRKISRLKTIGIGHIVIGCVPRAKSGACNEQTGKFDCLTTIESRSLVMFETQLKGSICAWCSHGCTNANNNKCEPKAFLDGKESAEPSTVKNFETCLTGNMKT